MLKRWRQEAGILSFHHMLLYYACLIRERNHVPTETLKPTRRLPPEHRPPEPSLVIDTIRTGHHTRATAPQVPVPESTSRWRPRVRSDEQTLAVQRRSR